MVSPVVPPVVPLRPAEGRRSSRIAEARGYHPRAHTLGDAPRAEPSRTESSRTESSRTGSSRTESSRTASSRTETARAERARAERARADERMSRSRRGGEAAQEIRPSLRLVSDGARGSIRAGERTSTRTGAQSRRRRDDRPVRPYAHDPIRGRPGAPRAGCRTGTPAARTPRRALPPPLADQGRRLRISLSIVMVLFLVIAGRLVQFQFVDGSAYAAQGLRDRLQPVDLPAPRGNIIDRDGAILAGSAEARYVYADPDLVNDPAKTADALSPVLGVPRSQLLPKLVPHRFDNGTGVRFEYLARGVSVDAGTRVSDLNLAGIGVRRDETRVVPGHDLAANLIGFTGRDMNGLVGLEASYDDLLRGVDGKRTFEIGQANGAVDLDQEIPGGFHQETPARPGSTLQLTIDRDLQYEVQRILGVKMTAAKATVAAAVVLDVRTGEVLAQASYPFYNAADPSSSKQSDWGDAASGLVVEPGSVHKGVVFAACLQEGVVRPDDTVLVGPSVRKGDTTYTDTHPNPTPRLMTLPGVLAMSSNVGTIALADRLGAQKLYAYQRAFGLGDLTGEHLPGESPGLVQPPANWSASSYGSIPIGHGVSVTPLQMAAVYAAIANGGVYVTPHLVKAVIAPDATVTASKPAVTRQVISADNAAVLRTMLEAVVTVKDGTGGTAAVANYRVSGKTGTGKLIRDGKAVDGDVASFVGMAPADAPRYVIAVFAHTLGGNGGPVAGPAFSEMMSYTLRHFTVAPTGASVPTFRVYG